MGKLFIVTTPIGNLADITLRAIATLKEVDVIACEDTRVTRKLLNYYKISAPFLITYHDKNEKNSAKGVIKLLKSGKKVALVSDAGTPLISDPGFELLKLVYQNEISVEIIPGVSAHLTAFEYANMGSSYHFLGFLSPKKGTRQNQLKKCFSGVYVIYVSPYHLHSTLSDLELIGGSDTQVVLAKELTKMYETIYRGTVQEVWKQLPKTIKGEYTLVFKF